MEDMKEMLIKEQKELKKKLVKLTNFISSEEFYKLSENNRKLLKNQKIAMELYLSVLNMRVFEDVDMITVPDLGVLQMMGSVFGSSLGQLGKNPIPHEGEVYKRRKGEMNEYR